MLSRIKVLFHCFILCTFCWLGVENASAAPVPSLDHPKVVSAKKYNAKISNSDATVGSLKGNFQVSAQGSASYSIPIAAPPGTADIAPLLSIAYSSEQNGPMGNGLIGTGFSLQGLTAITRCSSNIAKNGHIHSVDYTDQDLFCFNGEQLVAVKGTYGQDGTEYRAYVDNRTKIISYGRQGNGPASFKIWTKGGQVAEYALSGDSQIKAQGSASVAVWALNRITDTAGNYLDVHYFKDENKGEFYPSEINYTGNAKAGLAPYNSVKFVYEDRPDKRSWYQAGSKNTIDQRLHEIKVYANSDLVYDYHFNYEISPNTYRSRLISIQQCAGDGVCLKPTTFNWQTNENGWESAPQFIPPTPIVDADGKDQGVRFLDLNGTGWMSVVQNNGSSSGAWDNDGTGWKVNGYYVPKYPITIDGRDIGARFVSLAANGLTDLVQKNEGDTVYVNAGWLNNGLGWQSAAQYMPPNAFTHDGKDLGARIVDLEGRGFPSIIQNDGGEHNGAWIGNGSGWQFAPQYNPPTAFVDGNCVDLGVRLTDLTGNGLLGILQSNEKTSGAWINNGNGWQSAPQYNPPHAFIASITAPIGADLGVRLVDLTGNGLEGMVQNDGFAKDNGAWINTGNGWETAPQYTPPQPMVIMLDGGKPSGMRRMSADLGVHFVDFTGSGLPAIFENAVVTGAVSNSYIGAWFNNGSTWQQISEYSPPVALVNVELSWHSVLSIHDLGVRFVDLEGYGLPSIVQNNGTDKGAWLNKAKKKPDYLIGVTDGVGGQLKIDYETLSSKKVNVYTKEHNASYPNIDWQGPMYVVYQTASDMDVTDAKSKNKVLAKNARNSFGDNSLLHVTTYHYTGAKFNQLGYGFLGFHQTTTKDESTGINVTTTYSQDYNQHTVGQTLSSETRLSNGVLISSTQNIWDCKTLGSGASTYYAPYTKTVTNKTFDLNGNPSNTKTTTIAVDEFNNPAIINSLIKDDNTQDAYSTTTENTYNNNTDKWRIGELIEAKVTNSAPNTPDITRKSAFTYDNATGLLLSTTVEPNNPQYCVITTYTRDAFGNITSTKISGLNDLFAPRTSSVVYDPTGRFVIKNINALGQATSAVYDPRFGSIAEATDLNGLTVTNHYDGFGRLLEADYPDGTKQSISYHWVNGPNGAIYTVSTYKSGGTTKTEYFDQANRRVAETSQGVDGRTIWLTTTYDELGRVTQKTLPHYDGEAEQYVRFEYDILGRATKVIHPDGSATANDYEVKMTTTTNDLKQIQVKYSNVRDNLYQVFDNADGKSVYSYDAVGNLLRVVDNNENVVDTMSYDLYGHRIVMDDADKGHWTYQYDPLGELISQTDAMGQKTSFQYDLLGRMISRTDAAATSTWEYDTAPHGIGKLAAVNGVTNAANNAALVIKAARDNLANYSRSYVYDALGRIAQTITSVNGQSYVIKTSYDNFSRPLTATYPSGLQVQNHYNDLGYLTRIDNAKTSELYWQLNATNAAGQITSETNSNGLITNYTYNPKTGFLTDINTKLSAALAVQKQFFPLQTAQKPTHTKADANNIKTLQDTAMQGLHYSYDVIGNMTQRTDSVNNVTENFSYDDQNRLTQNSIVGGETTTYKYDRIGNLRYKSDVGDYFYGEKKAGPHALTSIISGITRRVFQYNANGDQLSGTVHGIHRNISYTSYSKPKTIQQGNATTNFYYNADRDEFMRTDVNTVKTVTTIATTLYLGNYEITSESDGQKITAVRQKHYIGNNTLVIQSDDGKNGTYVLLKDNLGSVTDIVDNNGNIVQHFTYTPYGEQKQTKGDTPAYPITHNGFTGHEEVEPFNLIHMSGRLYDPVLGRFLSADPTLQAPANPQDFNRYSYCLNNPLRFTDPNGFGIFDWVSDIVSGICDIIGDVVHAIGEFVGSLLNSKILGLAAQIIVGVLTQGATLLAQMAWQAATAAAVAAASGGDFAHVVLAAGIAFVSVGAWGKVGDICKPLKAAGGWGDNFAGNAKSCLLHGAVGGTLSAAEGGSFKDGFLSGAVGDACSGMVNSIEKDSMSQTAIMERSAAAGIVGGTVAVMTGGNFIDGAKTAAFAQIFNEETHKVQQFADKQKLAAFMGPNAVIIAERSLKGSGGIMFRDDFTHKMDIDLAHEEIFWTNDKGELYDAGYSGHGVRVGIDEVSNISEYKFDSTVYHASMNRNDFYLSGYDQNHYRAILPPKQNCQSYVDAMRHKYSWE
ncbi:MAG: RHS repeat-associated core domain-containing protein [Gammaproteobacteria bacterium]